MAAFIVATVSISDPEKFAAYAKGIAGLSESLGGEYVVRGKVTEVLEGDADPEGRIVILRFPDEAAARSYISSPQYEAAKALREGGSVVEMRLIVDPA